MSSIEPVSTRQLVQVNLTEDESSLCQDLDCQEVNNRDAPVNMIMEGGVKTEENLETSSQANVLENKGGVIITIVDSKNQVVRSEVMDPDSHELLEHLKPDNDCVVRRKFCTKHNKPAMKETKSIKAWTRNKNGLYGWKTRKVSRWKCGSGLEQHSVDS